MSTARKITISPEQFLVQERKAPFKSEYYQGEVFAMAGASRKHVRISTNLISEVHQQLKGKSCGIYGPDLRLKVESTGLMTYPDALIVCDNPYFVDDFFDTIVNPQVLFEILSPSTEKYDRGAKAAQYRQIPSLLEYILIAMNEVRVEQYQRQPDGGWLLTEHTQLTESMRLGSIPVVVSLADIYQQVDFGPVSDIRSNEN